jgi:transcriptional regulator with PAS, ATPase and Fis domain
MTRAIPILNDSGEIELVVITSTETQTYKMVKAIEEDTEIRTTREDDETPEMITNSGKIKRILIFCRKVAPTDSTILIQGESGTGKGVLAHFIQQISKRKSEPFLTINCAAIPEDLLESELFGYSKGAFTGANKTGKPGLIEVADGGTVFLDEVGEIPLALQAKILQVIQDKQFIPIGSSEMKKVDVRIIAATNQNLIEMINNKLFREDLFYRLNVIDVQLPPLRERKEDIIPLTYNFLYKFNKKYNENKVISEDCLNTLIHYSWPGNVRQLENLIERLVVISDSVIQVADLPDMITENLELEQVTQIALPTSFDKAVDETKRILIRKSYQTYKSSRKVASDLDISQTKASKLIRQYCKDLIN